MASDILFLLSQISADTLECSAPSALLQLRFLPHPGELPGVDTDSLEGLNLQRGKRYAGTDLFSLDRVSDMTQPTHRARHGNHIVCLGGRDPTQIRQFNVLRPEGA